MEVRRKQNESTGALLRRFGNLVKSVKLVNTVKSRKNRKKKLTERQDKNRALMGNALRSLRQRLERLGKFDDETFALEKKKTKRTVRF